MKNPLQFIKMSCSLCICIKNYMGCTSFVFRLRSNPLAMVIVLNRVKMFTVSTHVCASVWFLYRLFFLNIFVILCNENQVSNRSLKRILLRTGHKRCFHDYSLIVKVHPQCLLQSRCQFFANVFWNVLLFGCSKRRNKKKNDRF